ISWSWSLFFFSSRRRHTRSYGDWSSDVCSSDLGTAGARRLLLVRIGSAASAGLFAAATAGRCARFLAEDRNGPERAKGLPCDSRSEERRVGKECRDRGAPEH